MVNSKYVAFKVDKQAPARSPTPQSYSTVINFRKPGGKKAGKLGEVIKSQQGPLSRPCGFSKESRKRERSHESNVDGSGPSKRLITSQDGASSLELDRQPKTNAKPTRLRPGRPLTKSFDLDCWFTILRFSDPSQLLEMRTKIASCYRFLRNNPTLWKHSRNYYYGGDLPDPPAELTEFQYADLRHGHGCMSCGATATRKTYWAFMRRWCRTCFLTKTIREHDALELFKGANGEDISFIQKCLPSGLIDSWGNFAGVGPSHNHSYKIVYLRSDVQELVADFIRESRDNYVSWHAEMRTWVSNKAKRIEDRQAFARRMELWEDMLRSSKSCNYQEKKDARKAYFIEKASKLSPPIPEKLMQECPAFRRAVAIPRDPSMNSWLQLKPKLEKEASEISTKQLSAELTETPIPSSNGTSTPIEDLRNMPSGVAQFSTRPTQGRDVEMSGEHAVLPPREPIILPPINLYTSS